MIFREKEGVTLIIEKDKIDETIPFTFECFQITLNIHSSLEAVGFLRYGYFSIFHNVISTLLIFQSTV